MANGVKNIEYRPFVIKFHFEQRIMTGHHGGMDALVITQQQFGARFRCF
jgi:hypothetical protein